LKRVKVIRGRGALQRRVEALESKEEALQEKVGALQRRVEALLERVGALKRIEEVLLGRVEVHEEMINKTKKAAEAEIEIIGKKKIKENNKVGMTKNDKIETDQIEIGIILLSIQLNSLQEWIQVALGIKMRINQDTKKIQLSQNLMIFSQE